jgi:hypothetical protein
VALDRRRHACLDCRHDGIESVLVVMIIITINSIRIVVVIIIIIIIIIINVHSLPPPSTAIMVASVGRSTVRGGGDMPSSTSDTIECTLPRLGPEERCSPAHHDTRNER